MDIFIDLDGVLADFDEAYSRLFGHDPAKIHDDVIWANIDGDRGFFFDLNPCPGALQWFEDVRTLTRLHLRREPIILTACSKHDYQRVSLQKVRWVDFHIRQSESALIEVRTVRSGREKPNEMNARGDVLIDDWRGNIDCWKAAGGRGFVHRHREAALSTTWLAQILQKEHPLKLAA